MEGRNYKAMCMCTHFKTELTWFQLGAFWVH